MHDTGLLQFGCFSHAGAANTVLISVFCVLWFVFCGFWVQQGTRVQGPGVWVQGRVLGRGYMPKPKFPGKTEVLAGGGYSGPSRRGGTAGSRGVAGPPPPPK